MPSWAHVTQRRHARLVSISSALLGVTLTNQGKVMAFAIGMKVVSCRTRSRRPRVALVMSSQSTLYLSWKSDMHNAESSHKGLIGNACSLMLGRWLSNCHGGIYGRLGSIRCNSNPTKRIHKTGDTAAPEKCVSFGATLKLLRGS